MSSSCPGKVYVFGDQTFNYELSLPQLLQSDNVLLVWFFRKCCSAVQTELGRLPLHQRDATPKFTSINDLLARKRESRISPGLEQALCVMHTFASFIWQHSEGKLPYPTAQDSHLLGLCTGAFAAATVSSSRDLNELVPAAVHATVAALHTGLRTTQEAESIAGGNALPFSSSQWSMAVLGVSENDMRCILERFNSTNVNICPVYVLPPIQGRQQGYTSPSSSVAYLSSHSPTGLTISGPPSVLGALSQDEGLSGKAKAMLPIRSPYHAPHLYSQDDVDAVLQKALPWMPPAKSATSIPVLSCGSTHSVWAATSQAMLASAVHDVLTRPMLLEKTLDRLSTLIKARPQTTEILIVPVGTDAGETIQHRLQAAVSGAKQQGVAIHLSPQRKISSTHCNFGRSRIAVIGMSGRFPGASSPESLWELIQNKSDMCRQVPELRWDVETHVDPSGKRKNTSKVRWGCWLDQPDLFDNAFFSISPREAPQMDPAQRLALMTAYEALEDAGVVPGRTQSTREDRVGVFYGVTTNDWCESNSGQDLDAYYIPGANRAFIPGRINYFFKFSGPSFVIDTACSSSLSAIHIACNSLWQGDIDMAVVGGTNILTNPDMTTGLDKGGFLSATGNCKTFDESADGYCRGEGVATVILKRLEDAIEDSDPICGLIASAFTNHSAEAESITRPHVGAQKDVLERVLNDSGTAAHDVTYVEMHGTGTQAGDTREMNSVCDILAPTKIPTTVTAPRGQSGRPTLHLGALKANIGHGESASGVSALIKVLMMMKKGEIPPHCGIKTRLNPAFPPDLVSARNVLIDLEPAVWPREPGIPRKAIINNFSAAGGNTSILVEEASSLPVIRAASSAVSLGQTDRPIYPVVVSAKCARSLKGNLRALTAQLSGPGGDAVSLPQLSYTTTARRMHHPYRVAVAADTMQRLKSQLEAAVESEEGTRRAIPPREILFAFTGQGSQYPGMGKQLIESLSVFREQIQHFDRLARRLVGPSAGIMALLSESGGQDIADYSPVVVQLASVCVQMALARIWTSWGVQPTAVVGHSLGEYAALNVAGVLSDADTVFLVGRRALLLQEACEPASHAMLAASASPAEVREGAARRGVDVDTGYEVACANGPRETVLAGTAAQVGELQQALVAAGVHCVLLRVPYAFHSSQVAPIQTAFARDARGVVFRTPQLPVLSPLLGKAVRDAEVFGPEYLARHAREPVQMMKCLQSAMAEGTLTDTTCAVEFGPHPVVSGMIKSTLGSAINVLPTLRRSADPWDVSTKSLCSLYAAGLPIRWDGFFADIPSARKVIELPAYSWDLRSFWIPYRNDWTLTKGDIPVVKNLTVQKAHQYPSDVDVDTQSQPPVADAPRLECSTSIHRVLQDRVTSQGYDIVVDCDISRPDLQPFIQGHKVDGFGLCTPAVYADMGYSIGAHALKRFQPLLAGDRIVTIANMDIKRALIGSAEWKQSLRCAANFNWSSKDARVSCTVYDEHGNEVGLLATYQIKLVEQPDRQYIERELPSLKAHSARMRRQCAEDRTCRLTGSMAHRLVSSFAEFNPDYDCIDEIMFDSDSYEAVSRVSFGQMSEGRGSRGDGTTFHVHPGVIDGLTQSGSFVMNANETTKLETNVFVNHGWADLQLFEDIRDDCQYCTHVCMVAGQDQLWTGDVSVFTDDRIVGLVKGIRVQGVPRRLLKFILSRAAKIPKGLAGDGKDKSFDAIGRNFQPTASQTHPKDLNKDATSLPASNNAKDASNAPQSQRISIAAKTLEIISEQSGLPVSELHGETRFDEIGVDSLLSLIITSLFAEELGISADSALFLDNATVADMITALEASAPNTTLIGSPDEVFRVVERVPKRQTGGNAAVKSSATNPSASEQAFTAVSPNISGIEHVEADSNNFSDVLKIISEETGVPSEQLTEEASMSELGVDSLLALMIGSRLRDDLDMDVDVNLLLASSGSISSLRKALFPGSMATGHMDKYKDGSSSSSSSAVSGFVPLSQDIADISTTSSTRTPSSNIKDQPCAKTTVEVPPATSVVLQGSPRVASSALFIFPDGGGLASSYAHLPRIRADLVVYGLNSPFLKKGLGEDMMMGCTWDGMVCSYIAEVRRRQPHGPYSFAGWSAGGILSYRAAQMLMASGEVVRDLIMIDSPPPENLNVLPEHFFEYCATSGLLGSSGGVAPAWLIAHFRNINRVLSTYLAVPLAVSTLRKANILWACESSVDESFRPQPDDPEDMKFLTETRTDFTAGKWARLFPGVPLHVDRVEGRHHWNLLKGESARDVAAYIARILA